MPGIRNFPLACDCANFPHALPVSISYFLALLGGLFSITGIPGNPLWLTWGGDTGDGFALGALGGLIYGVLWTLLGLPQNRGVLGWIKYRWMKWREKRKYAKLNSPASVMAECRVRADEVIALLPEKTREVMTGIIMRALIGLRECLANRERLEARGEFKPDEIVTEVKARMGSTDVSTQMREYLAKAQSDEMNRHADLPSVRQLLADYIAFFRALADLARDPNMEMHASMVDNLQARLDAIGVAVNTNPDSEARDVDPHGHLSLGGGMPLAPVVDMVVAFKKEVEEGLAEDPLHSDLEKVKV